MCSCSFGLLLIPPAKVLVDCLTIAFTLVLETAENQSTAGKAPDGILQTTIATGLGMFRTIAIEYGGAQIIETLLQEAACPGVGDGVSRVGRARSPAPRTPLFPGRRLGRSAVAPGLVPT